MKCSTFPLFFYILLRSRSGIFIYIHILFSLAAHAFAPRVGFSFANLHGGGWYRGSLGIRVGRGLWVSRYPGGVLIHLALARCPLHNLCAICHIRLLATLSFFLFFLPFSRRALLDSSLLRLRSVSIRFFSSFRPWLGSAAGALRVQLFAPAELLRPRGHSATQQPSTSLIRSVGQLLQSLVTRERSFHSALSCSLAFGTSWGICYCWLAVTSEALRVLSLGVIWVNYY